MFASILWHDSFLETPSGTMFSVKLTNAGIKVEIKKTATDDKKNSCIFYTYYKENRLKHILHAGKLMKTDSPLFLYKP